MKLLLTRPCPQPAEINATAHPFGMSRVVLPEPITFALTKRMWYLANSSWHSRLRSSSLRRRAVVDTRRSIADRLFLCLSWIFWWSPLARFSWAADVLCQIHRAFEGVLFISPLIVLPEMAFLFFFLSFFHFSFIYRSSVKNLKLLCKTFLTGSSCFTHLMLKKWKAFFNAFHMRSDDSLRLG